jgi:hypothetical protein
MNHSSNFCHILLFFIYIFSNKITFLDIHLIIDSSKPFQDKIFQNSFLLSKIKCFISHESTNLYIDSKSSFKIVIKDVSIHNLFILFIIISIDFNQDCSSLKSKLVNKDIILAFSEATFVSLAPFIQERAIYVFI